MRVSCGAVLGFVLLVLTPVASAQSNAAARAILDDGWRLYKEGNYDEACPKFKASLALEPHIKTRGALAACYQMGNRLASAWAIWRDVSSEARAAGEAQAELDGRARLRMAELEPRMSRLVLVARGEIDGATFTLDDEPLPAASLGVPLPIDQGSHVLQAAAAGYAPWTRRIDVGREAEGKTLIVEIGPPTRVAPPVDAPPAPTVSTAVPVPAPAPAAETPAVPARRSSALRYVGMAGVGLGVLGLGGGAYFALSARSTWADAKDAGCPASGACPTQDGADLVDRAASRGRLATIFLIGGAALAAGGAVLWILAPDGEESSRRLSVGWTGTQITVWGRF